jgi:integrase
MGDGGGDRCGDDVTLGRYRGKFCAIVGRGRSRRKRFSLGTADPILARARFAEFRQERERLSRPQRPGVGAILDGYIADRSQEVADPARLKYAAQRLRPVFGSILPSHIDKALCRSYVQRRRDDGASIGTAHTELAMLRAALNWAGKQQPPWIDRVPHIWMPPRPEPRDRHLSPLEARQLLAACQAPHIRLFVLLALNTAARMSAILELTWQRVDLERGIIALRDPLKAATRKGRATVPINGTLLEALREARAAAIGDHVVEMAGRRVLSIKHGLTATAARAGLKGIGAHVLRHTAAVWMAEAGVPMPEIAAFMGHTDSRITERVYARFSPAYLRRAAAALERA